MPFETTVQVRFGDIDGAGIVFYPRYFEMLNSAMEDWFAGALGLDFHTMHMAEDRGIPVVDISASFSAPSVLGDILTVTIVPLTLGTSSCRVEARFSCNGQHRLTMQMTVVWMSLTERKAKPWPPELRERISAGLVEQTA